MLTFIVWLRLIDFILRIYLLVAFTYTFHGNCHGELLIVAFIILNIQIILTFLKS